MVCNVQAIVLAAGGSKRFNTDQSKLVAPICGKPMIGYIVRLLESINIPITCVVGHQKEKVVVAVATEVSSSTPTFVVQERQVGTGDAVSCSRAHWHADNILIINGDMPLLSAKTIEKLYEEHISTNAAVSFVTAHSNDSAGAGYGRVIQHDGTIEIVEARNFIGDPLEHCCVNAGIYLFNRAFLEKHIDSITQNSVSSEWYLTDLIKIASDQQYKVHTVKASFDEVRGVNTLQELWATEHIKRAELVKYWMDRGVRFLSPQATFIDTNVTIGHGTVIGAGVHILNHTQIGTHCIIREYSTLDHAIIENNVVIKQHSVIEQTTVAEHAIVGPFAHIHTHSIVGNHAVVGNFVEVKKSTISARVKAKHLSYIGDASLGTGVNVGAGTVVCNYDGARKHQTVIHEYAFIGSNNTLIAPLTIHAHAFTAAGSTITHDVPAYALAIGRERQVVKLDYAKKLRPATVHAHDENNTLIERSTQENVTV